jgi:hypothetical protein
VEFAALFQVCLQILGTVEFLEALHATFLKEEAGKDPDSV